MISHEYRCIFIHIPKCAGTSVERALGHWADYTGWSSQDHRTIRMIERPFPVVQAFCSAENVYEVLHRLKHRYVTKAPNPRSRLTVTREQYDSYFKFTIVRNPWARAFSWYANVLRDERHRLRYCAGEDVPFGDFMKMHAGHGPLRPQVYWLKAFDGSIPLDYIARFENLSADMDEIFSRLNVAGMSLPHELRGPVRDYRVHYDDETNAIIERVYKDDIETFGYAFD
jgi:hypothetical protein